MKIHCDRGWVEVCFPPAAASLRVKSQAEVRAQPIQHSLEDQERRRSRTLKKARLQSDAKRSTQWHRLLQKSEWQPFAESALSPLHHRDRSLCPEPLPCPAAAEYGSPSQELLRPPGIYQPELVRVRRKSASRRDQ